MADDSEISRDPDVEASVLEVLDTLIISKGGFLCRRASSTVDEGVQADHTRTVDELLILVGDKYMCESDVVTLKRGDGTVREGRNKKKKWNH